MAKKSCQCKKPGECEECPEWIFTFADLVMLMMGFFVILWVLKPPAGKDIKDAASDEQWLVTVGEIRRGFGYEADPKSTNPVDQAMIRRKIRNGPQKGAESERSRESAIGTDHDPTSIRPGKQTAIGGRLLFTAGDVQLTPQTRQTLDQIAEKIRGHYNIVLVKGHSSLDDLPDTSTPHARMDLSVKRAQAVVDYLIEHGVDPSILQVQGCSDFEPVKQRDYGPNGQAQNRRVEIEVSSTLIDQRMDPSAKNAAPQINAPSSAAIPSQNSGS